MGLNLEEFKGAHDVQIRHWDRANALTKADRNRTVDYAGFGQGDQIGELSGVDGTFKRQIRPLEIDDHSSPSLKQYENVRTTQMMTMVI